MDFRKYLVTGLMLVGISSLFTLSGQAMATTTILGPQSAPISLTYAGTYLSPQNQFYDEYMFSIDSTSVDSITSTINLGSVFGIDNLQTRLYSGTVATTGQPTGLLQAWSSPIMSVSGTGYSGTIAVISPITLGAGNYVLEVRGDVVGTAGGSYVGVLNISPISEPGEWALMAIGLALVCFAVSRRGQNDGQMYGLAA